MKNKLKLAAISTLLLFGISSVNTYANTSEQYTQTKIEEQKAKIIKLAKKYTGKESPEARAELEAEVEVLLSMTGPQPIEERIKKLPGAWKQLYGPVSYGSRMNIPLDPERIYQVVMKEGYYYNIGYSEFFGGKVVTTGFLKGEYKIEGDGIQINFVNNHISLKTIPGGVDLKSIVTLAENRNLSLLPIPLSSRAREPGFLSEDYIDDTLRISHGGNPSNPREYFYVLKAIKKTK